MFYEQFQAICKRNDTTPTALVKKLGLSSAKVTAWKNGSIPKAEILQRLSAELKVPVSAFFEDTVPAKMPQEEIELLDVYRQLSKSGQRQLLGKAYELLDGQNPTIEGERVSPPDVDLVIARRDVGMKK